MDDTRVNGALLPCTLSYKGITELLKGRMGFEGVVLTDDCEKNLQCVVEEFACHGAECDYQVGFTPENMIAFVKGLYSETPFGSYAPFPLNPITRDNNVY